MLVCFDFIRTQSDHSRPFWNIFVEIELNFRYNHLLNYNLSGFVRQA